MGNKSKQHNTYYDNDFEPKQNNILSQCQCIFIPVDLMIFVFFLLENRESTGIVESTQY